MATTAVDGRSLAGEQAAGRAFEWGSDAQGWIFAHNREIGFTSNPDELFNTVNGVRSATDMGVELTWVGYTGPYDRGSIVDAYKRTTSGNVLPYTPAPSNPGGSGSGRGGTGNYPSNPNPIPPSPSNPSNPTTPVIGGFQLAGDPWQWLKQSHLVLGVQVPGWLMASAAGVLVLSQRRRR